MWKQLNGGWPSWRRLIGNLKIKAWRCSFKSSFGRSSIKPPPFWRDGLRGRHKSWLWRRLKYSHPMHKSRCARIWNNACRSWSNPAVSDPVSGPNSCAERDPVFSWKNWSETRTSGWQGTDAGISELFAAPDQDSWTNGGLCPLGTLCCGILQTVPRWITQREKHHDIIIGCCDLVLTHLPFPTIINHALKKSSGGFENIELIWTNQYYYINHMPIFIPLSYLYFIHGSIYNYYLRTNIEVRLTYQN